MQVRVIAPRIAEKLHGLSVEGDSRIFPGVIVIFPESNAWQAWIRWGEYNRVLKKNCLTDGSPEAQQPAELLR